MHSQDRKRRRRGFCGAPTISLSVEGLDAITVYLPHQKSGEAVPSKISPGIRYFGGLLYSAPVGIEVVLGGGKVTVSGEGGRHGSSADLVRTEQSPK